MKTLTLLVLSVFLIGSLAGMIFAAITSAESSTPVVDSFENYNVGDNASSVWEEMYHYEDDYSVGGNEIIEDGSQVLEVSRSYLWHNSLNKIFFAKMKVVESSGDYQWYGSRLALVNPKNPLERYELRLYPHQDKIQVNYVDRTGRTGSMTEDLEVTTSEIIASADCDIDIGKWYYVLIMRSNEDNWKTMVFSWNKPTCILRWNDDRIDAEKPAIGIQSAGKYVITRFDELFAI